MNEGQLDCFVRVAKTGSFHETAQELGITQPGVTKRIQALEAQLGVTLFRREGSGMALTDEGSRFLETAITLLGQMTAALNMFRAGRRIVLGYFYTARLDAITSEFAKRHPRSTIQLVQEKPWENIASFISRPNAVLVAEESEAKALPGAVFAPLFTADKCVLVSARNLLASKESVAMEDLIGQTIVVPRGVSGTRASFGVMREIRDMVPRLNVIEMESAADGFEMVRSGGAAAIVLMPPDACPAGMKAIRMEPPEQAVMGYVYLRESDSDEMRSLVSISRNIYALAARSAVAG